MKTDKQLKAEAQVIAEDAEVSDGDICLQIAHSLSPKLGSFTWRKLMAAKMLPGAIGLTVGKIVKIANVDRKTYYRLMNKPEFNENFVKAQIQMKGQYVGDVMKAFLRKAMFGDADHCGNSTNQLAYLRDMGIIKADKSGDTNITVVITQEEREEKLKHGLNRLGYSLADIDNGITDN